MTRYEVGFMNKCAEYGLDVDTSLELMKEAGFFTEIPARLTGALASKKTMFGRFLRTLAGTNVREAGKALDKAVDVSTVTGKTLDKAKRKMEDAVIAAERMHGERLRARDARRAAESGGWFGRRAARSNQRTAIRNAQKTRSQLRGFEDAVNKAEAEDAMARAAVDEARRGVRAAKFDTGLTRTGVGSVVAAPVVFNAIDSYQDAKYRRNMDVYNRLLIAEKLKKLKGGEIPK